MALLPWKAQTKPLMLAPMQGLTNEALRACFIERYQPDVVFTEFVRVQTQSRKRIARADLLEIQRHDADIPLVVQLIGHDGEALNKAAEEVQAIGCLHLNLNLGCPYGRMTTGATGGELLKTPKKLPALLEAIRKVVRGSFSVKCRSGYTDARQLFELLPVFEESGVDFLILHPRTVEQKYTGLADHGLTVEVANKTSLPVVANGDINTVEVAHRLLSEDRIAGVMIGRGALADPHLFRRIRQPEQHGVEEQRYRVELAEFISDLIPRYLEKFCGERQALMKLKDVLNFMLKESLQRDLKRLKRATSIKQFEALLEQHFMV